MVDNNLIGGIKTMGKLSKPWLGWSYNRKTPGKSLKKSSKKKVELVIHEDTSANKWDEIGLKEIAEGPHKGFYQEKSPYQYIQVVEVKDLRMYLDGQLQFSSLDERIYHEAFVHIPFALTSEKDRILIVGGGDGLALREVLKYSEVAQVDLVDIDEKVLQAAQQLHQLVKLNEGALYDDRVNIFAEDALKFISNEKSKKYNVIIVDFPDPSDEILAKLYTVEVFQQLQNLLDDKGVLVCQSNELSETPTVFWSIGKTMEQAGFETKGYHTIVPSFGDWGFQLGSKQKLPNQLKEISVQHRTLPADLDSLFSFPPELLVYKNEAIVNSEDNLKLHLIYKEEMM
jgi:spermidine synthase